jgi:hypothetical protein
LQKTPQILQSPSWRLAFFPRRMQRVCEYVFRPSPQHLLTPGIFFRAGCSVYDGFAKLSVVMHEFIPKAGYSKPGEGGMGRMNQYLRDVVRAHAINRSIRVRKWLLLPSQF